MIVVKQETGQLRVTATENLIFQNVHVLQEQFQEILNTTPNTLAFVLDLSQITVVDSMGLKLVVGLYNSCQEQNRNFSLETVAPHVAQVFRLCGLHQHLTIKLIPPPM